MRSRIDRLHADDLISWFEWRCATEFRNLYDQALGSQVKASSLDGTGRGSGYRANLRPSDHQLMALRRLCDLQGRLDRKTIRLLKAVVVDELSWCELGKRLRCTLAPAGGGTARSGCWLRCGRHLTMSSLAIGASSSVRASHHIGLDCFCHAVKNQSHAHRSDKKPTMRVAASIPRGPIRPTIASA